MRLEEIVLDALRARGGLAARLLSDGEREEVRRVESEHSMRPTPWGKAVNRGLLECLEKRFVVAVLTSPGFEWPPGPYALIVVGDRTVGTVGREGVRLDPRLLAGSRGEHLIVLLPLKIPELDGVLQNPTVASPSPPTHSYLLRLMGASCPDCGTLLVGCDGVGIKRSKSLKEYEGSYLATHAI